MSAHIKSSKVLFTIFLMVSFVSILLLYIYNDKESRKEAYLQTKDRSIQIQYNTIYTNYKIACDNVYVSLLKNEKMMGYFKDLKNSSYTNKDEIRDKLHLLLKERYERIKKFGVWQLHFHLPNNESFLRMHKPKKFGDDLTKIRYSVDYVNKNKKWIEGFEVGRVIHGFRFVYPILDEKNIHHGSVEISMSSEIFKDTIESSYNSHVDFILKKDIIEQKLWKDQITDYYEPSIFSDLYLKRKDKTDINLYLDSKVKDLIYKKLQTKEVFSINVKKKNAKKGILTFLPIKNIKDNQIAAYFVAYQDDEIVHRLEVDFYVISMVVIFIAILILIFLIKDENYKHTLESRIEEKTRSLAKQKELIQKKYEEQVHILNTLNEAVLMYDGNICYELNQLALDMLGFKSLEEFKKEEFLFFIDKLDREKIPSRCDDKDSFTIELYIKRKDGKKIPVLLKYHAYCTGNKCMVIISLVDLTELKEKEKYLMQQSKLAQMGEMISMIAHQWRQPLAAISSTTSGLMLKTAMGKFEKEFFIQRLENISDYSQHLSSTIDDFRNFFKSHKEKRDVLLETIIEDSLKIIQNSVENNNIKIEKDFKNNSNISTYPNELRQVVLNLLKNSEDALIENNIKDGCIKLETFKENGVDCLAISDNAGGIPSDIIEKVFEPYFSTKTNKNGTGLGLYMSKTIIEEHCEGKLTVFNDDKGAVFRIEI